MPIGTKCSNCGSPVTEPTFGEPPYLCPRCEAAREECSPQRTFAEPAELADSNRTALVVLLALIGGGALLLAGALVLVGLVWSRVGEADREAAEAEGDSKPVAVVGPPQQAVKKEREKLPEEVKPKFVQPGPVEPKPPIEPMVPAPLPMPMVPVFPRPFEPKPRPVEPAKPSLTFPYAAPVEMKPAPLAEETVELKLPGVVADTCVGGGGRYWILHIPSARQLAILDINEARIVKYLPVAAGVRFAAGMNKLVAIDPQTGSISRYDLKTFAKEKSLKLPFVENATSALMGSASGGPLLLAFDRRGGARSLGFANLDTFEELEVPRMNARLAMVGFVREGAHLRLSPDGRLLGFWSSSVSPSGLNSIRLSPTGGESFSEHTSAGFVVPTANGQLMTGIGLFTAQAKPLKPGGRDDVCLRVPSQTGAWYLKIPGGGGAQINTVNSQKTGPTQVYRAGEVRAIATLPHVKLPAENEAWIRHDFTGDKRVLFVPEGRLIAVIPPTLDRVLLHRFDLEAALEKSGIEYLYVNGQPPLATPGKMFTYVLVVKSKKGGVKIRLDSGPDGMKLEGTTLTWKVPPGWSGPEIIVLTIQDASEREELYSFTLEPVPLEPNGK